MAGGSQTLLPREPWPEPASAATEAPRPLTASRERVWIIDPQTLFRRGLILLLQQWNPSLAVLDAPDLGTALAGLGKTPGLVLVDAAWAGQRHFAGLARLLAEAPAAAVVLLAGEPDWKLASQAIALGARGYVPKSASEDCLRQAVALVRAGEVYLPREVLCRWSERRAEAMPAGPAAGARLTPRQSEVLQQLTLGLSNKEIARSLGLLESTVKVHVKTILKKLAASNRTQAAMMALDMGFARRSPG